MSARRVGIVLLCEDSQQESFARRFLIGMGRTTRELRILKSPTATGSAEQWVREVFPDQLSAHRSRCPRAASALIVMIDADSNAVEERINDFAVVCQTRHMPFRGNGEAVAIVVPKRNIETWISYLNGETVDEIRDYPRLDRERECKGAVDNLVRRCKITGLEPGAPASLLTACSEYQDRVKPLIK